MAVIGRMDEQVDAVLIGPLERRGRQKEDARARPSDEQPRPSPQAVQVSDEAESSPTEKDTRAELPIWLL